MSSYQHLAFLWVLVAVNLIRNAGGVLSADKSPRWGCSALAAGLRLRGGQACPGTAGLCTVPMGPRNLCIQLSCQHLPAHSQVEVKHQNSIFLSSCEIMRLHSSCVCIIRAQPTRGVIAVAGLLLVSSNSFTC